MWFKVLTAGKETKPQSTTGEPGDVEAQRHIAAIAGAQRMARGGIEDVSMPGSRRLGRRLVLVWVWIQELIGRIWRRLLDSHEFPGRPLSRLLLYRPLQTFAPLMLVWVGIGLACIAILKWGGHSGTLDWVVKTILAAAFTALILSLWLDAFKSPYIAKRIRRRVIEDPTALLRITLAKATTKIVDLEPPLETVPRNELYDELLPGVLARAKDTQIIVGDPGAGKTTALLDLSSILARIGFVPVLLQLRGECGDGDLFERAKHQFEKQIRPLVRVATEVDIVWRWLCRRQRLVFLVDDLDQIGFEGEPGFHMRRMLEDLAPEGQAVIVTARPSGVPVGIAASAISLEPLSFETAVDIVAAPRERGAAAGASRRPSRRRIESWVRGGDLQEAPLYLEALAEMTSVGVCPGLPEDPGRWEKAQRPGRWRERRAGNCEWNPLWVRYLLLQGFYDRIVDGHVRPSLAIEPHERERCVQTLEGAALGVLAATGLDAAAVASHVGEPEEARDRRPRRRSLVDFITTDDRRELEQQRIDGRLVEVRSEVSRHEAIDTGERLRLLERDLRGEPQFRHRIMQAFFAGRCLAEMGRSNGVDALDGMGITTARKGHVRGFDYWVQTLLDPRHPERLTAHLTLTFAAIHADARCAAEPGGKGSRVADRIAGKLLDAVCESRGRRRRGLPSRNGEVDLAAHLDPMEAPDPYDREDPDDNLMKLTTAADIAALLRRPDGAGSCAELSGRVIGQLGSTQGAMRWTKRKAIPAIARLDTQESWEAVWKWFAQDTDYEVRRSASRQLERNAGRAFSELAESIDRTIFGAGRRAARGLPLAEEGPAVFGVKSIMTFEALGWVLPAIVSGLNEERGGDAEVETGLNHARVRLEDLVALAFAGGRPKLEDSLAQGFKADAMRHASAPGKEFTGAGWVATNRRLVADVGLPHAESWYARMLLYQALALYAVAGTGREDTLDVLAHRLHRMRERHPLARQAAKLARAGLRRAQLGDERWRAFVWSDDVESAAGLPSVLGRRTGQLVSDVSVLVDLKEGSSTDRHEKFGHMEELPYCLSGSSDRHEILGAGCPAHCGWGFCPYRAAAPDEPNQHRGIGRGFCRAQRRASLRQRPPGWQRKIRRRKMREFWRQMEYKARR
jgi:hypothetical protein